MLLTLSVAAFLLAPPLPDLRTEATDGGSVFHVRNTAAQPLTSYLIELVNYPGSFFMYWQDETNAVHIPPGGEKQISIVNMTVGAVPEYVKIQAAIYADGSTAGTPEKIMQLTERRRHTLATARELITRLEKTPPATAADLRQWANTIPPPTRANRATQAAINNSAAVELILNTAAKLESASPAIALTTLRAAESALSR